MLLSPSPITEAPASLDMKTLSVVLALALGLMARSSPVSAQVMNASAAVSALKVGEQVRVQARVTYPR